MKNVCTFHSIITQRLAAKMRLEVADLSNITATEIFDSIYFNGRVGDVFSDVCNIRLVAGEKRRASKEEIRKVVGVVFGCCFYRTSLTELLLPENRDVYMVGDMNHKRVKEILWAFDGAEQRVH